MRMILVVDDSQLVRDSICALLKSAGYANTGVASGKEALAIVKREAVAMAIIDIWMPRLNGLELLKEIRNRSFDFPIIVVSGGGPNMTLEHAATLADIHGANHLLFKPFEDDELLTLVRTFLPDGT